MDRSKFLAFSIALLACGGSERSSRSPRSEAGASVASLAPAHVAPERASSDGFAAANTIVESAFAASIAAGQGRLVTHGTLIVTASGRRWTPDPTDRLIVENDGQRFDISVTVMDGDFNGPEAFFAGAHVLEASARTEGADISVRSARSGSSRTLAVRGATTIEGVPHTFDLTADGTEHFENDSTGTEYREAHHLAGTFDWSGAHLDVDEGWEFNLVSARGEGSATVTSAVRTISNELDEGGHRYAWRDVRLQKAFRDGRPNEIDTFWSATGEVTRDGTHHGDYRLDAELVTSDAGFLKFLLVLPSGPIEVESWRVD